MDRTQIISGKLVGFSLVELDEPVAGCERVDVSVCNRTDAGALRASLLEILRGLEVRNRAGEVVDRQIEEEQTSRGE